MTDPSTSRHAPGVLVRRLSIRVLEISRAGCLIESAAPLVEGTVGLLDLDMSGRRRIEAFRICRTEVREGASPAYRAAAQFLTIAAPSEHTLRQEVGALEAGLIDRADAGTMSGDALTSPAENEAPCGAGGPDGAKSLEKTAGST